MWKPEKPSCPQGTNGKGIKVENMWIQNKYQLKQNVKTNYLLNIQIHIQQVTILPKKL